MTRVRIFSVHTRPSGVLEEAEPLLIAEGFSWPAFFFGAFWALAVRCWFLAAVIFGASVSLALGLEVFGASETAQTVIWIGYMTIIGFSANDWRRSFLARSGWRFDAVVAAGDREGALLRWLDQSGKPSVLPVI